MSEESQRSQDARNLRIYEEYKSRVPISLLAQRYDMSTAEVFERIEDGRWQTENPDIGR